MSQGLHFEAEVREQPRILRDISASGRARDLAAAVGTGPIVLTGSGSSLFVAQLAATALRRSGRAAVALAASEARFDRRSYTRSCVVALSQSGRTADVLTAIDALEPTQLIALTNDPGSPLAARSKTVVDCGAGTERAVPASKSVTAMAAIALWAAAPLPRDDGALAAELLATAGVLETWLADCDVTERWVAPLAAAQAFLILGSGFGVAVASEIALKIKEAAYRHAEGFSAGEFRHGSTAIVDGSTVVAGIVDSWSRPVVEAVLATSAAAGATVLTIGDRANQIPAIGPRLAGTFAPLGWIVAGQVLALALARRLGIDSDRPRGLAKYLD